MIKRLKLCLSAALLLMTSGVFAQDEQPTSGDYYLYNEEGEVFLSRGAGWGTQAIADKYGVPFTINASGAGYELRFFDMNNTLGNAEGAVYTDNINKEFTFTKSGTGWIAYNTNAAKWLTIDGSNILQFTDVEGDATVWNFKTQSEYNTLQTSIKAAQAVKLATVAGIPSVTDEVSLMSNLTANYAAKDKTSSVQNATLSSTDNWTFTVGRDKSKVVQGSGILEVYQGSGNLTQTVSGLTQGIYKVTLNAFYRDGSNANCVTMKNNGWVMSNARLVANDYEVRIKDWASDRVGDANPNSMAEAASAFTAGKYLNELYTYVGEDGVLNLKIDFPAFNNSGWFLFGKLTLTHYDNSVSEEEKTALLASVPTGKMSAVAQSELDAAKNAFVAEPTIANFNTLKNKVDAANISVEFYAVNKTALEGVKKLLQSTNVYISEAYSVYNGKYEANKSAWDAGTLTESVSDPYVVRAWHEANDFDDFLLSAWTIGGEQCANFEKSLYINTWSNEGVSDGSNFKVPFFEYWTDDDKSLGANTLSATVATGKANQNYEVKALVRVRETNNKTAAPTGITLQVGEATAVSVTSGAQVGTSQFYLAEFTAYGVSDAEGNLIIKFNVESDNNISWLSFKNVKYAEIVKSVEQMEYEAALAAAVAVDQSKPMNAIVKGNLNTALTTYATATAATYEAAAAALNGAVNDVNASITGYASMKAMLDKCVNISEYDATVGKFTYCDGIQTSYSEGSIADAEMNTKITELRDEYRTYLRKISDTYRNANAFGTNIDLTTTDTPPTGWTCAERAGNKGTITVDNKDSNGRRNMFENFSWSGNLLEGNMFTTVEGLPNGKYFLRAQAATTNAFDTDYIYIKSGANEAHGVLLNKADASHDTHKGNGAMISITKPIEVTNGTVELGLHVTVGTEWAHIGVVELKAYEIYDHPRTSATDKLGTICLPYNATVEGAKLYTAAINGNYVTLTEHTGNVEAGVAYIYEATAAAQTFTWAKDADLIANPGDGDLKGVFSATKLTAGSYVMQTQNDVQKFFKVEAGNEPELAAYRAYLSAPASEVSAFNIAVGEATGINAVTGETLENAVIYNLNGQKLNRLQKGINIINGVKVIVK